MENSLLVTFGEIWPKTMYYSTGSLAQFFEQFQNSILIGINSKFLRNISTCICIMTSGCKNTNTIAINSPITIPVNISVI